MLYQLLFWIVQRRLQKELHSGCFQTQNSTVQTTAKVFFPVLSDFDIEYVLSHYVKGFILVLLNSLWMKPHTAVLFSIFQPLSIYWVMWMRSSSFHLTIIYCKSWPTTSTYMHSQKPNVCMISTQCKNDNEPTSTTQFWRKLNMFLSN